MRPCSDVMHVQWQLLCDVHIVVLTTNSYINTSYLSCFKQYNALRFQEVVCFLEVAKEAFVKHTKSLWVR